MRTSRGMATELDMRVLKITQPALYEVIKALYSEVAALRSRVEKLEQRRG